MTKYQDQNFTLSDVDGQERIKEGKSEVWKFDNLEDKSIFFDKTKSIFGNFLRVLFW